MGVETRTYLLPWILTLFTRTMSLDMVSNMWDIFFVHNLREDLLIETAYLIISALKPKIGPKTEPE